MKNISRIALSGHKLLKQKARERLAVGYDISFRCFTICNAYSLRNLADKLVSTCRYSIILDCFTWIGRLFYV